MYCVFTCTPPPPLPLSLFTNEAKNAVLFPHVHTEAYDTFVCSRKRLPECLPFSPLFLPLGLPFTRAFSMHLNTHAGMRVSLAGGGQQGEALCHAVFHSHYRDGTYKGKGDDGILCFTAEM